MTLYIRSILVELGISQDEAVPVYEDNRGCLQLATAQQPTCRTRHIETHEFVKEYSVTKKIISKSKKKRTVEIKEFEKDIRKLCGLNSG